MFLLIGVLLALSIGYALRDFLSDHLGRNRDRSPTREEIAEYESKVLPSKEDILKYLDGKAIPPTDAQGTARKDAMPLILKKEAMRDITLRREGYFFTIVTFTLETDEGPYAVEILINHNPVEGSAFVFDSFRVQKASRL